MIARNIAAYHHERYDGYGYPEGKKGDEIPIEARIFAVCDVFDALTSQRPYKAPLSCDEAMEIILSESGKHFDPDIVETFLECRGEIERIRNSFGH
ncbi:MAG: HD domain-containing phosphohydrolase [Candidatus Methanomethyliaceae archaeon]